MQPGLFLCLQGCAWGPGENLYIGFSAAIDRCLCNECALKPEVAQGPARKFQVSQGRFHSDPAGAQMYRQTARGFAGAGPMPLCEWRQPRR